MLVMCANNYLGLAQHPALAQAAAEGLARWGYGLSSVRFICGTQGVHKELEGRLSAFLGTEDTILYSSCFDANTGLFETLLGAEDALISDELNHASIIDGVRLCKARRLRYRHSDLADLEAKLKESADARFRLIATDGVFSMDGDLADLPGICDLADRYDALVMVDDSHAVGFMGPGGRGTPEHHGVGDAGRHPDRHPGQGAGGRQRRLHQRAQGDHRDPAPALAAVSVLQHPGATHRRRLDPGHRAGLGGQGAARQARRRTPASSAQAMTERGFDIRPGIHPIVPIMLGDASLATRFADVLLGKGVYAVGFSYPVVPHGQGPHPRAGLGGPLARGPRLRRRDVHPDPPGAAGLSAPGPLRGSEDPRAGSSRRRAGWPRTAARSRAALLHEAVGEHPLDLLGADLVLQLALQLAQRPLAAGLARWPARPASGPPAARRAGSTRWAWWRMRRTSRRVGGVELGHLEEVAVHETQRRQARPGRHERRGGASGRFGAGAGHRCLSARGGHPQPGHPGCGGAGSAAAGRRAPGPRDRGFFPAGGRRRTRRVDAQKQPGTRASADKGSAGRPGAASASRAEFTYN